MFGISFIWQNCRYGYPSVAYVSQVVANYSKANIPLETQWMDIDYMDKYLDFTLDPVDFSPVDMTAFVTALHNNNQHFIPIVDPGIYVRDDTYDAYTSGMEQNVFVMDMTMQTPYLGQVCLPHTRLYQRANCNSRYRRCGLARHTFPTGLLKILLSGGWINFKPFTTLLRMMVSALY